MDEYAALHPLPKFCDWFLTWAQHILQVCRNLREKAVQAARAEVRQKEAEALRGDQDGKSSDDNDNSPVQSSGDTKEYEVVCALTEDEDGIQGPTVRSSTPPPATCAKEVAALTTKLQTLEPSQEERRGNRKRHAEAYSAGSRWAMGRRSGEEDGLENAPFPTSLPPYCTNRPTKRLRLEGEVVQDNDVLAERSCPSLMMTSVTISSASIQDIESLSSSSASIDNNKRQEEGSRVANEEREAHEYETDGRHSFSSVGEVSSGRSSGNDGVGVLHSIELHKQIWRFFTPSQLT